GSDFLANACGTGNKNPATGARNFLYRSADGIDSCRGSGQLVVLTETGAQDLIFPSQPFRLRGTRDQMQKPVSLERFFDEIRCTLADRGNGRVDIAMAGNHENRNS